MRAIIMIKYKRIIKHFFIYVMSILSFQDIFPQEIPSKKISFNLSSEYSTYGICIYPAVVLGYKNNKLGIGPKFLAFSIYDLIPKTIDVYYPERVKYRGINVFYQYVFEKNPEKRFNLFTQYNFTYQIIETSNYSPFPLTGPPLDYKSEVKSIDNTIGIGYKYDINKNWYLHNSLDFGIQNILNIKESGGSIVGYATHPLTGIFRLGVCFTM